MEVQYRAAPTQEEETLVQTAMSLLEPAHLEKSALLWIADDMADVLLHAARSLPPYAFDPATLPWPKAVCMANKTLMGFDHPADGRQLDVKALQWSDRFPSCCVLVGLGGLYGYLSPVSIATLRPGVGWAQLSGERRLSESAAQASAEKSLEMGRLCCTLWLLLQQRVAVRQRAWPDRTERRRWERSGRPIPEVTIVELRKPIHDNAGDGTSGFVDWSHRWMVDGHWRNQYHPSTGEHVPTWIAPYLKGPEDKPLVMKRKINAWIR